LTSVPKEKGAPAVATQDSPDRIKLNTAETIEPSTKIQETVAHLQRDYIVEALRIAVLKAARAADDVEIGDDDCAERGPKFARRRGGVSLNAARDAVERGAVRRAATGGAA
jgi:hypothetical protein